ncbi:MAG TPA: MBL fold metallo-hydrolase [Terriglobia bacterium]|jgi:glyoxylase-like metal-dependent hydrolase (beta-lactamase superfamily II)
MKACLLRTSLLAAAAAVAIGISGQTGVLAQYQGAVSSLNANNTPMAPPPLPFWRVRNTKVFLIPGAGSNGANVAVQVGRDGVAMVDSGSAENADKLLATVKYLENLENSIPQPLGFASETRSMINFNSVAPAEGIRWIINTTIGPEHIGGNEKISGGGVTISGGNVGAYAPSGAAIFSREELLARLSETKPGQKPTAAGMLPTDTYSLPQLKFNNFVNGEGIMLYHAPKATTDGDTIVYFRGSDVIVSGDLFRQDTWPVIDVDKGGTIQGVLDALNHILDLSIPEFREEGGTMIIPGHGRLSDSADVGYYRDMCTVIRDRIQDMVNRGLSLQQVRAAKPTMDYDLRYGTATGPWTTDMFVEAVYKTLKPKK